jgi:hypothetical protein
MNRIQLLAVGLAALTVTTGAALALPGAAPASSPADDHAQADGHADENATDADAVENGSAPDAVPMDGNASDADAARGPPADLPAQVPDFVSDIHDAVRTHVEGTIADLGDVISGLTPGGADESAGDHGQASGHANETASA